MSGTLSTEEHCGASPPVAVGKAAASSVYRVEDAVVDKSFFATVRERRSFALTSVGLNPDDFCDCVLTDTECVCQAIEQTAGQIESNSSSKSVPPISDLAWASMAEAFPPRHANQILDWRQTFDLLSLLANTGIAWVRLGNHSEAVRARLHRSRPMMWSAIERRIIAADIADDERVRIQRTIKFSQRYIGQREARTNSAPTPTAAVRLQ
jgi:hypothetical protein